MSDSEKQTLISVHSSLNSLEVRGANNLKIVLGCMQALERLFQDLKTTPNGQAEIKGAN